MHAKPLLVHFAIEGDGFTIAFGVLTIVRVTFNRSPFVDGGAHKVHVTCEGVLGGCGGRCANNADVHGARGFLAVAVGACDVDGRSTDRCIGGNLVAKGGHAVVVGCCLAQLAGAE